VYGLGLVRWLVPVDGADFLHKYPPPGKMWNSLNTGGYLLYSLAPGIPVFIDGRSDTLYGKSFFDETLDATRNPAVFFDQLERYQIGFAVVETLGHLSPSYRALAHAANWALVYSDDCVAIAVRKTQKSASYLVEHGFEALSFDPAEILPRLANLSTDPQRESLAAEVMRNLRQSPGSVRAHYMAAMVHKQLGRELEYQREREIVRALAEARSLAVPLP
jgi:hypothetical protein